MEVRETTPLEFEEGNESIFAIRGYNDVCFSCLILTITLPYCLLQYWHYQKQELFLDLAETQQL